MAANDSHGNDHCCPIRLGLALLRGLRGLRGLRVELKRWNSRLAGLTLSMGP
jgi:hypothetical protein